MPCEGFDSVGFNHHGEKEKRNKIVKKRWMNGESYYNRMATFGCVYDT